MVTVTEVDTYIDSCMSGLIQSVEHRNYVELAKRIRQLVSIQASLGEDWDLPLQ